VLGVAELYGEDVLEEVGYRGAFADVAGQGEGFGVLVEERAPAGGGGVIPCEQFFGSEAGHGWLSYTD
jgi:hypothetical protein